MKRSRPLSKVYKVINPEFLFILDRLSEIIDSMPDTKDNFTLLGKYHQEWTVYRDQLMYLPGPFRPLEEEFLNRSDLEPTEFSIVQILLLEWYTILQRHQKPLCEAALELIKQEREGQINQHQQYVVSLKDSFSELSEGKCSLFFPFSKFSALDDDIYGQIWVKQYINETEQFYKQRADGVLLESNDTQSYMRFACRALEEEEKRCEKYLLAQSRSELMEILTQVLVVNNAELIRSVEVISQSL